MPPTLRPRRTQFSAADLRQSLAAAVAPERQPSRKADRSAGEEAARARVRHPHEHGSYRYRNRRGARECIAGARHDVRCASARTRSASGRVRPEARERLSITSFSPRPGCARIARHDPQRRSGTPYGRSAAAALRSAPTHFDLACSLFHSIKVSIGSG